MTSAEQGPQTVHELIGAMLESVPTLAEVRESHVHAHGQLQPERLFSEILHWLIADYDNEITERLEYRPGWRESVDYLNHQFADREDELTSFVLNTITDVVPDADSRGASLVSFLRGQIKPSYFSFLPDPGDVPQEQLDLVNEIVQLAPALLPMYEEYFDGEYALTYMFFADLTDWVVADFQENRKDEPERQVWREVLNLLDERYAEQPDNHNDAVRGLIYLSFLDYLPRPWEPGAAILDELGTHLLVGLKAVHGSMEICRIISRRFPELRETYEELFASQPTDDADPSEEFFAAATRWACRDYLDFLAGHGRKPGWRELMDLFEREYAADGFKDEYGPGEGDIAGAIENAVLPELPTPDEPAAGIREHLGPRLTEGLAMLPTIPRKQDEPPATD